MDSVNICRLNNLIINNQTVELKNQLNNSLKCSFSVSQIKNAQTVDDSKAKITFLRDQSSQNNLALISQHQNNQNINHYSIDWLNPLSNEEFCVDIGGDQHWYFTYEEFEQRWPIDKNKHFHIPQLFIVSDQNQSLIGSVVENLFFGSKGFGIFVERSAPLFLRRTSDNGNQLLCFSANYDKTPFNHSIDKKDTKVIIHLFCGTDIMHVYRYAANQWIPKPKAIPDLQMMTHPIWSTWAKYHKDINQEKVLDLAQQISRHGFKNSHLEIDDKWETNYGDFAFDPLKFADPKQMVSTLKSQGFRSTLWVYPFVNHDSKCFDEGKPYFIRSRNGSILLQDWWNGRAAHIDFTNKEAQNWFVSRLEHIKEMTGIESFKFDAGELGYVGPDFQFSDQTINTNPNIFSKLFSETAFRFGNLIETRVGFNAQHISYFVRMLDKNSIWDYSAGLQTLIPTALMMSIAGYPFVLPDMIGGNAYGNFPSKELFIRWLEVNTFMPCLQFSITPWDYSDSEEVIEITKSMLKLHEHYSQLIINLAENAVKTGEPIMRPLWWVAPTDPNTFTIDDQFLLGNDLLVAPVTIENARQRNIYLPSGQWKDQRGVIHSGEQTLIGFKAELNELPFFIRQSI